MHQPKVLDVEFGIQVCSFWEVDLELRCWGSGRVVVDQLPNQDAYPDRNSLLLRHGVVAPHDLTTADTHTHTICTDNKLYIAPAHNAESSGVECGDGKAIPDSKAYQFKQLPEVLLRQGLRLFKRDVCMV